MDSIILKAATRILMALILLFAVYMLLRGHNAPGGGFIGGLITCTAFVLYKFAHGTRHAREIMNLDPRLVCMLGLISVIAAGLFAVLMQSPFLTGVWLPAYVEGDFDWPISTVLLFDIGVFLTVVGGVLTILMALGEED